MYFSRAVNRFRVLLGVMIGSTDWFNRRSTGAESVNYCEEVLGYGAVRLLYHTKLFLKILTLGKLTTHFFRILHFS